MTSATGIPELVAERDALLKRVRELEAENRTLAIAARNIAPYLKWTVSDESPGHHPTMPSAVSSFLYSTKAARERVNVRADRAALNSDRMGAVHRWEGRCMADDPFAGDFGGSGDGDGILADKMVTNRKGGTCSTCGGPCEPGTRNRVRTEVYDGEFMRFRWCVHCCFAMAVFDIRPSILESRIPGPDFGETA